MKIKLRALLMLLLVTTILLSSIQTEVYGINTIELEGKMVNGRFLVPMRNIFEAMNVTNINWDGKTRKITVKENNTTIILTIDSKEARINDKKVVLDTAATLIDGRTYVPLRFIGESLGASVHWNNDEQVAHVHKDGIKIRISKETIYIKSEGYFELNNNAYYGVQFSDGFFVAVNIDSFDMVGGAITKSYFVLVRPNKATVSKNITILGSGYFDDYYPLNKFEYISNYSTNPSRSELLSMDFYENLSKWNGKDTYIGLVHFKMFSSMDSIYFNDGVHECYLLLGAD